MSATTAPAPLPTPDTEAVRPAQPPTTIVYDKVPHPLADGSLLLFDAERVHQAIEVGSRGAALRRAAYGTAAPPEAAEVQALELRLRRRFLGRSRTAWGAALWWVGLGVALSLLWINFAEVASILFFWLPPLQALIASLGSVAGGPLLAALVGLLPLIWCWRRAWRLAKEARRWGRLTRFMRGRRFRESELERSVDPALAAFVDSSSATADQLRSQFRSLADRGADAAGQAAGLARTLYRLAAGHGLVGAAGVLHGLYARLGAAELRLGRIERTDSGVFAERRAAREAQQAIRQARASLAPFGPRARATTNPIAPFLGGLAGASVALAAWLVTSIYFVEPDQAVIIDPPGARLSRILGALGLPVSAAEATAVDIERGEGYRLGWPRPFADRHSVALSTQRMVLGAPFRRSGPTTFDVMQVELRFQIADLERWAAFDRTGDGVARLGNELSAVLYGVIQRTRAETRQNLVRETPSLANDEAQLARRADEIVEGRLEELVRAFVTFASSAEATRDTGIQIAREYRSNLQRGVQESEVGTFQNE